MEVLKQRFGRYRDVYTTKEIREETVEVIVPDCNPDYEKEISTFAECRITDKSILSGNIRISGDIKAITYYDSMASESMYAINAESKFSCSIDVPGGMPEDIVKITSKILSADTEVLNSRKIRIVIKIFIEINVSRIENLEVSEDACGQQGEGINVKIDEISQTSCVEIAEKIISFTEEIRLSDDEIAQLARVFKWECKWKSEEVKTLQNKIMIRGVAHLMAHSCVESAKRVESKEYVLPFSQVLECKNICETDVIDISLNDNGCFVKIIAKEDGNTFLKCDACANVTAHIYRKIDGKMLLDIYSTEYDVEVKNERIYIENGLSDYMNRVTLQEKMDINDIVSKICYKSVHAVCSHVNDKMQICFYVSVFYENEVGALNTARTVLETYLDTPENIVASSLNCETESFNVSNEAVE